MIKIEYTDVYGFDAAIRGYPEYKVTKDGQVIGKRGKPNFKEIYLGGEEC